LVTASSTPQTDCLPIPAALTSSLRIEREPRRSNGHRHKSQKQVIVNLIAATTTQTGLKVRCHVDPRTYRIGRRVSEHELADVNLVPDDFHGEWNYTIYPDGHEKSI
jgi:hypothetical protein